MKKLYIYLIAISLLLVGCNVRNGQSSSEDKLNIVTTFYPIYDITKNIVGDTADVTMLIKAGVEVHGFEPSAKDIATIEESDALIYANENMESWIPSIEKNLESSSSKVKVISATKDMILLPGDEEHDHSEDEHDDHDEHDHEDHDDHNHEGHSHALDPHVWVSPFRAIKMVESIRDDLIELNPTQKDLYTKNSEEFINKLKEVDKEYTDTLSKAKQKSFVTQHSAFNYIAKDYGLKQVSVLGLTPDVEPSAKKLAELADFVKKNDVKYIYFEETASSALASTLAKETGVKTSVLNPLESLTEQDLAKGKDYISTLKENLEALKLTTEVEGAEIKTEVEEEKTVYKGYFEDKDVADRPLSDYAGNWQSVYPYLLDGTLDQVWDYKAKDDGATMSAEEFKEYYTVGYKTDVEQINIDGNTMEFIQNGKSHKFTYKYSGYEILTYKKGNRGVRFLFETDDQNAGNFKYVQFSDHKISPEKTDHFHIYFGGESHSKLLEELENWPTYYPTGLNGKDIAQEMLAH